MKKILLFITLISIAITQAQIINIPDTNFKNALINASSTNHIAKDRNDNWIKIDYNNDNEIQVSEAENVYQLYIGYKYISNLAGIEHFINVNHLSVRDNNLESLDLSNNINLKELRCRNNNILSMNLSNINLEHVYCSHNSLESLDVSTLSNLKTLICDNNSLESLDVSTLSNLKTLSCGNNLLESLDVSNLSILDYLTCSDNFLTSLNFHANLRNIIFNNNLITSIDVSNQNFLNRLHCSNNPLASLDLSNNSTIRYLDISNLSFTVNYNHLTLLKRLKCSNNSLTDIDISGFIYLTHLFCSNNLLTNIDISNNPDLETLNCSDNLLTNIDISNNPDLINLYCSNNSFINIDMSNNTKLKKIKINDNINLNYINLQNGNNSNIDTYHSVSDFTNLPNLQAICVDQFNTNLTSFINSDVGHFFTFTTDCSIDLSQRNNINGNLFYDINNDGCNNSNIAMSEVMIISNNGVDNFATFTQNNGDYLLHTNEGDFTTSVTSNFPSYFTINPNIQTNTFVGFNNTFTAGFCIEPNQTINDVNVSIMPTWHARPGFNATYKIIYKNIGTTQLNGNITLEFDNTKLSFLNASVTANAQTSNSLTFDYTNLNPFETRTINLTYNILAPPTVEIDDILNFTATINPISGDYTPDDNIFTLNQTVIGSYDPNDITCLEGDEILLADADKYLHYIIRFQNTGTASAINVSVKNILDTNLDWSTLQLESSSHYNRVAIKNGNEIEFIFENINLPDSTTDEPNSHGFIAYKIKPKTDIALGNIISNKADIFFDYNEAVETNTATTTIVSALAVNENTLLNFSVYPTPMENILNIKSKTEITKIKIYSKLGQLIKKTTETKVDVSNLTQGLYFVKVEDINGSFGVKKFIKR